MNVTYMQVCSFQNRRLLSSHNYRAEFIFTEQIGPGISHENEVKTSFKQRPQFPLVSKDLVQNACRNLREILKATCPALSALPVFGIYHTAISQTQSSGVFLESERRKNGEKNWRESRTITEGEGRRHTSMGLLSL